jgi:hypothetical protein
MPELNMFASQKMCSTKQSELLLFDSETGLSHAAGPLPLLPLLLLPLDWMSLAQLLQ